MLASKDLEALLLVSGTIKPSHSHYYYLTEFWEGTQTREREKTRYKQPKEEARSLAQALARMPERSQEHQLQMRRKNNSPSVAGYEIISPRDKQLKI